MILMWNYQYPFLNTIYPFSPYQWPQFTPHYSFPIVHSPPTDSALVKDEPNLVQKIKPTAPEQKDDKKLVDTIASRISRKYGRKKPIKKKQKEDSFDKKKQKKDRNLPSNICRFFISFLYNHGSLEKLLGDPKEDKASRVKKCVKEVKKHVKPNQTYVRPSVIDQMCHSNLLGEEESKMFRLLFRRFILVEFRMIISMMGKLRKKEKLSYFKIANRFLRQFLASP